MDFSLKFTVRVIIALFLAIFKATIFSLTLFLKLNSYIIKKFPIFGTAFLIFMIMPVSLFFLPEDSFPYNFISGIYDNTISQRLNSLFTNSVDDLFQNTISTNMALILIIGIFALGLILFIIEMYIFSCCFLWLVPFAVIQAIYFIKKPRKISGSVPSGRTGNIQQNHTGNHH